MGLPVSRTPARWPPLWLRTENKTMFGNSIPAKTARKAARAWTLVEMLISLGIFSICGAAIASLFVYGTQTFAALYNYATLDALNRNAMDVMTREIRQALAIT